jgi:integrase
VAVAGRGAVPRAASHSELVEHELPEKVGERVVCVERQHMLTMKVEDLRPKGAGWQVVLHEKGGKHHVMPCHHALAEALRAYIAAAGIADDSKGFLFRTSRGHKGTALSEQPMVQSDAWRMIRRRAAADRQSQLPRDRNNRLSIERRRAGARAGDGGARKPKDDETL